MEEVKNSEISSEYYTSICQNNTKTCVVALFTVESQTENTI